MCAMSKYRNALIIIIIYFIQRVRDIGIAMIAMIVYRQWRTMLGDIMPHLFIITAPLNHLVALMDDHGAAVIP